MPTFLATTGGFSQEQSREQDGKEKMLRTTCLLFAAGFLTQDTAASCITREIGLGMGRAMGHLTFLEVILKIKI